jgi:hypothetical protein
MKNESLHIYMQQLKHIRGIFTDGQEGDSAHVEWVDLAEASGVVKSVAVSLMQAGSCGLLEPSGRPPIIRDIHQPFVDFQKQYWMSALKPDQHRQVVDEVIVADSLQVSRDDQYRYCYSYF